MSCWKPLFYHFLWLHDSHRTSFSITPWGNSHAVISRLSLTVSNWMRPAELGREAAEAIMAGPRMFYLMVLLALRCTSHFMEICRFCWTTSYAIETCVKSPGHMHSFHSLKSAWEEFDLLRSGGLEEFYSKPKIDVSRQNSSSANHDVSMNLQTSMPCTASGFTQNCVVQRHPFSRHFTIDIGTRIPLCKQQTCQHLPFIKTNKETGGEKPMMNVYDDPTGL